MPRPLRLLAATLLLLTPMAEAGSVTITLKNGQVITYDLNNVKSVVVSNDTTVQTPVPTAPVPTLNWAGVWRTDENSITTLTLTQQGNTVSGTYPWQQGRVNGTVNGREFVGTWSQSNGKGNFRMTLSADGRSFKGAWNYAADGNNHWRDFTGWRP